MLLFRFVRLRRRASTQSDKLKREFDMNLGHFEGFWMRCCSVCGNVSVSGEMGARYAAFTIYKVGEFTR